MENNVIVIGGGAAGMMAAYAAARRGLQVTLAEKNEKVGKKLFITGKGRCNITNDCDTSDFFMNVSRNSKFLMSAVYAFPNTALIDLLEENGLRTKVERGGRVFPTSDRANDVIRTLEKMLRDAGVKRALHADVEKISKPEDVFYVYLKNGDMMQANALILATGGKSYPLTGSTGDGYRFAQAFGHNVVKPVPALVPLEDAHGICPKMQGLALKNIGFTLFQNGKQVYGEQGELLFTHFGISGPVVLSASNYIDHKKQPLDIRAEIDFKPALSAEKLDARLVREFEANQNKQLKNVMANLLPQKMIYPFLREGKLDENKATNSITKEERIRLGRSLKHFSIRIADTRPIEEAIVTAGGVDTKEINPSTMESKIVHNLYFAGEIIDVHALTGGFNLQIAFSTGFLAGSSVFD
ncbi:NAD(P)/FAD-dependent oxidoreductase [Christensenella timonensis]|uniref:NAD(P)/FAD-dependent oxidoreductase n=1 Tax=Christensenella timonensis TaxID=1816678 RepID=UPI0008320ACD|nr:NAD(P)/FAD-dependent oxidoreductase [Christensenella timonensis]